MTPGETGHLDGMESVDLKGDSYYCDNCRDKKNATERRCFDKCYSCHKKIKNNEEKVKRCRGCARLYKKSLLAIERYNSCNDNYDEEI